MSTSESNFANQEQGLRTKLELQGKISSRKILHMELDNGITVTTPEAMLFKPGFIDDVGTIIDIVCKFIDCGGKTDGGGGSSGGGNGCTTITIQNPDGSSTTIKTCPPKKTVIA